MHQYIWNTFYQNSLIKIKSFMSTKEQFHSVAIVHSHICVWPFATQWTAAHQASLSITNLQSLLKLMSITSVMLSNRLFLCHPPLLHPQFFPGSGSFPMSQFFTSGGQSIGVSASASVLPVNIQDWIPLGWTGWISLQFKGLSRVFSNTTVRKHQFFDAQLASVWFYLIFKLKYS